MTRAGNLRTNTNAFLLERFAQRRLRGVLLDPEKVWIKCGEKLLADVKPFCQFLPGAEIIKPAQTFHFLHLCRQVPQEGPAQVGIGRRIIYEEIVGAESVRECHNSGVHRLSQ
jgi:hypothetical protein